MNYDLIIVGAGPSGTFCAYELIKNKPNSKILIVEKGYQLLLILYEQFHQKNN